MRISQLLKKGVVFGFIGGSAVSTLLLIIVPIIARQSAPLWFRLITLAEIIFPTHIFLLPLQDGDPLRTKVLFIGAAIIGNGLLYAVAVLSALLVFILTRRLIVSIKSV